MSNRTRTVRLSRLHETLVYACVSVLLLSGLLWLLFHYFVIINTEFGKAHHPVEAWSLKVHGFAAIGMLILFGSLMPAHIRNAWQHRQKRWTGGFMIGVMVTLSLSGYGLYYLGGEEARDWTSILHWVAGILSVLGLAIHVWQGRRKAILRSRYISTIQHEPVDQHPALHVVRRHRDG